MQTNKEMTSAIKYKTIRGYGYARSYCLYGDNIYVSLWKFDNMNASICRINLLNFEAVNNDIDMCCIQNSLFIKNKKLYCIKNGNLNMDRISQVLIFDLNMELINLFQPDISSYQAVLTDDAILFANENQISVYDYDMNQLKIIKVNNIRGMKYSMIFCKK